MYVTNVDITRSWMDKFAFETIHTEQSFVNYSVHIHVYYQNVDITHSRMDQFGFEGR